MMSSSLFGLYSIFWKVDSNTKVEELSMTAIGQTVFVLLEKLEKL